MLTLKVKGNFKQITIIRKLRWNFMFDIVVLIYYFVLLVIHEKVTFSKFDLKVIISLFINIKCKVVPANYWILLMVRETG